MHPITAEFSSMAVTIYKKGQGYWTRIMSAIAYALIVGFGAVWLWELLSTVRMGELQPVYVQGAAAVVVIAVFGVIGYWLIGRKPAVVDFMIATEGEMKKVNWSSWREIRGSTAVVIALTIFIALLCSGYDFIFATFFRFIGVLDSTA
jgi:preprotein translocase SecE subunit